MGWLEGTAREKPGRGSGCKLWLKVEVVQTPQVSALPTRPAGPHGAISTRGLRDAPPLPSPAPLPLPCSPSPPPNGALRCHPEGRAG